MATLEDLIPVLEELSVDNRSLLTRIEPFILTTGKPGVEVGAVGSIAIDMTAKVAYGPKASSGADPWGDGDPFTEGPAGASAKAIVIAAGELPPAASDEDFATWLANAQIDAVQPFLDAAVAARDAALAAQGAAETAQSAAAGSATAAAGSATAAEAEADAAAGSAAAAAGSASAASASASAASASASAASASAASATAAQTAAETARDAAQGFALAADGHADAAAASEAAAELARTGSETARAGAETAETNAETARDAALAAQTAAEGARDEAETAATTATTKAGEASASATAAATAETNAEAARDAALAAQAAAELARDEAEAIAGGDFQPGDATLTALAALDSAPGAVVQTGADAFTKRAIGAASSTDLLDRAAGDGRYQPLDSDLTAIAALSTTSFGRGLLVLADAAAGRTAFGLGTAALADTEDFQPADSDLAAIAALTTTSYGRSLLTLADAAALKGGLSLGLSDVSGLAAALAARVQTVNGVAPDGGGNVVVAAGVTSVAGQTGAITAAALKAALALAISDVAGLQAALDGKQASLGFTPEDVANRGQANGYASLGADGKVPSTQLPASSGGGASDSDIAALAEAIARLKADQLRLARGVADDFSSTDGVDLAASNNEFYDAANKRFRSAPIAGSALSNNMTSNTAPSPDVASGSLLGANSFRAFDGSFADLYGGLGALGTLERDFGAGNAFSLHSYRYHHPNNYSPAAWTVEGSNDGVNWTVVDTRSGISAQPSSPATGVIYTLASPSAFFRHYRLNVSGINNSYFGVQEIGFFRAQAQDLSLRSIAYTALASPANGYIRVKATALEGPITPGTNLRAYASRDNGTTWVEATLTYLGEFEGGRNYHGDIAFTGPAGTSLRWRVDTTTSGGANIAIDDVTLLWSE
jgi:chemotaxis protein histidine kinase CheA